MELASLAATISGFLAPVLPYLIKGGEEAAKEVGKKFGAAAWEKAKDLWARLRPRLETKPAAQDALQELAQAPEDQAAQGALNLQVRKILAADSGLAQELVRWVKEAQQAGVRITVASGDRSMAAGRDISITEIHYDQMVPRPTPLTSLLHQLPADLPDFTGRDPEVEQLLHLFLNGSGRAAISALGGLGGVGKTALAVHVAHKLAGYFPEAQIVVDLAGTSEAPLSPVAAMSLVITAFEPQVRLPESPGDVVTLYRSVLAGRRALLLLDNAAKSAQVRDLLPSPPAGAIVTSRRNISLPGLTSLNLDVLPENEAGNLLRTILGPERATDPEVAALAERCGYLPLALRAAGSFLASHRDWQVGEYLEALSQEKERLRRLQHEDLQVEAVLGLSVAGLARENPEWAKHWQMLTTFPASFDRAGAGAVWGLAEEQARDTLSELLTRSLLLYDEDTGRYRLHDLMRLVARNAFGYGGAAADSATDIERLDQAATRHAAYYEKILMEANDLYLQGGAALGQGLALFDQELTNIRAGQAWAAAQSGVNEKAARLCNDYPDAGVYMLLLRLHPRERIAWLDAALAAARRLQERGAEGAHLNNLGNACHSLGEYRRAIEYHELALVILREIGNRRGEGNTLGNLGNAYYSRGEQRRAIDFYEQALGIFREIGDRRGKGGALGNLGLAYSSMGEYRRTIEYYEQALDIFRETGDRWREGTVRWNLSLALEELGERQQAMVQAQQALEIYRQIEDPFADTVQRQLAAWRQES